MATDDTQSGPLLTLDPADILPPVAHYTHVVIVPAGHARVFVSGQVGTDVRGEVPDDLKAEARNVWANIANALRAAGARPNGIAKVTTFIVSGAPIGPISDARSEVMDAHRAASTLLFIAGLSDTRCHYEVEVEAIIMDAEGAGR
ncbi:MAG: RidA family protein [Methylocystis sp.]|jgi:2-iminobutanoate/2-iminopropanoate deaminase|nr:RidA family protein [Methylocystis sp.]MCA3587962.1 RidA family protein [Methylocystis sp.]MCA3592367.1 RidA family protein [Methylocystis sp.]